MDLNSFKAAYERKVVLEYDNCVLEKPTVSICIQAFQHVDFISECIKSVLSQKTKFDFEIIIGDDDSNDGTREICIEYAKKYPKKIRLLLHHRENNIHIAGKPTGRFNFVYNLLSSKGQYIALCEGDDYWTDPYKLQKQIDFLESSPDYSMCFHEVDVISEFKEDFTARKYSNLEKTTFETEDFFARHIVGTCSMVFRNLPKLYKNLPRKISSGDKWLILLLSLEGKIKYFKETMAVYRLHDSGISRTHQGIVKVYDMALLLHEFDAYSGYKFTRECHESLSHEIEVHITRKLNRHTTINDFTVFQLIKIIGRRAKKILKKIFYK